MEVVSCLKEVDDKVIAYVSEHFRMIVGITRNIDAEFGEETKTSIQQVREQLRTKHPELLSIQKFCDIASDSLIGAVLMSKGGALKSCMCESKDIAYFLERTVYTKLMELNVDEIQIVTAECFNILTNSTGIALVYFVNDLSNVPEAKTKKLRLEEPVIVLAEGASILKIK